MLLARKCPVCNAASGRLLHTQRFVLSEGHPLPTACDYIACDDCGFCFADTPVPQSIYDTYYADMSKYSDSATSTGAGHSPWDAARLEHLAGQVAAFSPDRAARLLDIGCANGGLFPALRGAGYRNACGIDPSPSCVRQARTLSTGEVWTGTLSTLPRGIGTFDGVLLSHVMEHVRDLRAAMERLRTLLNPGGWIYIEVPDASRYEEFLVSPFQDFNTEHINHFSSAGLANLCRACGFAPESGGAKEIFSAKDMPYPAVFWFARMTHSPQKILKDDLLPDAISGYVRASRESMNEIDVRIRHTLAAHKSLIVWGTGQLTMKLLTDTCLRDAEIVGFVDGNPVNQGRSIRGLPVAGGEALASGPTPILVCSLISSAAIIEAIRNLGLTNPVVTLSQETA